MSVFWRATWQHVSQAIKMSTSCDLVIPLLGMCPKEVIQRRERLRASRRSSQHYLHSSRVEAERGLTIGGWLSALSSVYPCDILQLVKIAIPRATQMARLVKCVPHKHQGLSSDPQIRPPTHTQKPDMMVLCTPRPGKRQKDPQGFLASLAYWQVPCQ